MGTHLENKKEIDFLTKYEKGDQPILQRIKEVRPEINNRIVENHAAEVVNFYRGYVFGTPIAYIQRAAVDSDGVKTEKDDDKSIALLNEMFAEESKAAKDQQLAKDFFIGGVGYRLIFPKKEVEGVSPFSVTTLPNNRTFIIYSSDIFQRELAGVYYYEDEEKVLHFTVYTAARVFYIDSSSTNGYVIKREAPSGIGHIPIIEYKLSNDRMGIFERALPLLEAINLCTSDRLNGLAQHIQSFIWMNNVEITSEQAKELADKLLLLTKSEGTNPVNVEYLTSELNQSSEQVLKDDLYNNMLQITGVPSRETNTGGDTGQAVQLRNGFEIAESIAKSIEPAFEECERKALRVALAIIESHESAPDIRGLKISDIGIQFSRNRTDNLLTKIQAFATGVNAGVHPLKMLEVIGLFSDAQQVYNDSQPYLAKYIYDDEEENAV